MTLPLAFKQCLIKIHQTMHKDEMKCETSNSKALPLNFRTTKKFKLCKVLSCNTAHTFQPLGHIRPTTRKLKLKNVLSNVYRKLMLRKQPLAVYLMDKPVLTANL